MVTYSAKKKKDLIIAGGVLTGVGVALGVGVGTLYYNTSTSTSTVEDDALDSVFFGSIYGGIFLIPGIVTLSLGLAAKQK